MNKVKKFFLTKLSGLVWCIASSRYQGNRLLLSCCSPKKCQQDLSFITSVCCHHPLLTVRMTVVGSLNLILHIRKSSEKKIYSLIRTPEKNSFTLYMSIPDLLILARVWNGSTYLNSLGPKGGVNSNKKLHWLRARGE